jgi:FG-GAP-like repeat/Abnormal spindle-like microcephaly-assoc'd, ASPM-SPD-2-Hydin/FG-GAP repeat
MKCTKPRSLRRVVIGVLFAVLGPLAACAPSSLAQSYMFGRADFTTGASPKALVAGDFNGDGKLDLATANSGDNTVSILIGNPDGTFQPHADYQVGTYPSAIAAADFNGDGRLDFAVANSGDKTVSILLGDGTGNFSLASSPAVGYGPCSVAVGDFNGDGKLDLAVANEGSNTVSILLGDGTGHFTLASSAATGLNPVSVAVGDFSGDGRLDLAVGNSGDNTVSILLGDGTGNFNLVSTLAAGRYPISVALGDFNGDDKLDVAVVGGTVSILLGDGMGSFTLAFSEGMEEAPTSVAVADFNKDGKLDLVFPTPSSIYTVAVLLGDGTGRFERASSLTGGDFPVALAVGDFNGDGALDLAGTYDSYDTVSVALGNSDGTFGGRAQTSDPLGLTHYDSYGPMAAADFNADGKSELSGVYHYGLLDCGHDPDDGVWVEGGARYGTGGVPSQVAVGDFDGDGRPDLVVINVVPYGGYNSCQEEVGDANVAVLLGDGDLTFKPAKTSGSGWSSMVVGDFNGDGRSDLAVSDGSNVGVLLGKGDGTFSSGINTGLGKVPVTVGDFNGDGKLDLVIADAANNLSLLLGNGDGTFGFPISIPTPGGAVVAADFNVDGRLDLAVANRDLGTTSLLPGNGDGTFQTAVSYSVYASILQVADVNDDGKPDLVLNSSLLLSAPDGTFRTLLAPELGGGVVGDFDGDGNTDYAFSSCCLSPSISAFLGGPVIALYPDKLTFGLDSAENGTSQTVLISNPGVALLKIAGIALTGDFTQTNDCGPTLASAAACTITVTPALASAGTSTGSISITDDAPGSPHLVSLTAAVTSEPELTLLPESLSFGNQGVSTTSPRQTSTLTSTGSGAVVITSVAASGDFAQTNTCGGSVAAGASCAISVTFTPTAPGTRTGAITITDNAPGSPHVVSLTGTGTGPAVSLSPTSLSFGYHMMGTAFGSQTVTLTNTGNAALSITSMAAPRGFTQTNTCGASVAAGASCSIQVTFTPTAAGAASANLTMTDNAPGSPHAMTLTGIGTATPVVVSPQYPTPLEFGSQTVGSRATLPVLVANAIDQPLTLRRLIVSPRTAFSQTNNCGASLAPSLSCTIAVTFAPQTAGARHGIAIIIDNSRPRPVHLLRLSGHAVATTATAVRGDALRPAKSSPASGSAAPGEASPTDRAPTASSNSGQRALNIQRQTATCTSDDAKEPKDDADLDSWVRKLEQACEDSGPQ